MTRLMITVGAVFALIFGLTACDPPEVDGDEATGEQQAQEVSDDGPSSIDDGGITEFPDDPQLVEEGEDLFAAEGCAACHQMDADGAGPALGDVTERRSAPWLARMIMHPQEMTDQDPKAKALSENFPAPMTPTDLDAEQTKALLAYLNAQ